MLNDDFANFLLGSDATRNEYYWSINTGKHGDKAILVVPSETLVKTKYGYGLPISNNQIIWLKNWQISKNQMLNGVYHYYKDMGINTLVPIVINETYFKPSTAKTPFKKVVDITDFETACELGKRQNLETRW